VRLRGERDPTRLGILAVLVAGLIGLAVALAVTMSQKDARFAGTNDVPPAQFAKQLPAGGEFCQAETIFGDSHGIRFLAFSYGKPGPPLEVYASKGGGATFMHGRLPGGWRDGSWLYVPTQTVRHSVDGVVCVRNQGATAAVVNGWQGTARFEYVRARESWWGTLPAIVHRFGLAKAGWEGSWTVILVLVLMLGAVGLATWSLVRPRPS
jgi:hypothetical protein